MLVARDGSWFVEKMAQELTRKTEDYGSVHALGSVRKKGVKLSLFPRNSSVHVITTGMRDPIL